MLMEHLQLQKIIIGLLNSIDDGDRDIMSDNINMNLIRLIQEKQFKSVMFIYNSPIEPSIDKAIIYCLNHNIDCYFVYNNKKDFPQTFKIAIDNHDFEYYRNTIQPIPKKFVEVSNKIAQVELVIAPLLAYDRNLNVIDYEAKINTIKIMHGSDNVIKCGYAFSIQEMHSDLSELDKLEFDYVANEYYLLKKH